MNSSCLPPAREVIEGDNERDSHPKQREACGADGAGAQQELGSQSAAISSIAGKLRCMAHMPCNWMQQVA